MNKGENIESKWSIFNALLTSDRMVKHVQFVRATGRNGILKEKLKSKKEPFDSRKGV